MQGGERSDQQQFFFNLAQASRRNVIRERDVVDGLEHGEIVIGEETVRAVRIAPRPHDFVEVIDLLAFRRHHERPAIPKIAASVHT